MPIRHYPNEKLPLGFEGQLVYEDQGNNRLIGSQNEAVFNNAGSGLDKLPYGRFVQAGAGVGDYDIIQPGGTAVGVTYASELYSNVKRGDYTAYEANDPTFDVGYPQNRPITILKEGAIFIVAEVDINRGDPLFVRVTSKATPGATEGLGRIRTDADGTDGGVAEALDATRVALMENVTAGCVAKVYVDFPLV